MSTEADLVYWCEKLDRLLRRNTTCASLMKWRYAYDAYWIRGWRGVGGILYYKMEFLSRVLMRNHVYVNIFVPLQYGLYQSSRSGRGYSGSSRGEAAAAAAAAASFQPQLVSSILCPPPYQGLASPGKHVTVVTQQPQLQLQPSLLPQQVGLCLLLNEML